MDIETYEINSSVVYNVVELNKLLYQNGTLDKVTVLLRQLENIFNSDEWRSLREQDRERTCMVLSNIITNARE
jgi:hypothetical protein